MIEVLISPQCMALLRVLQISPMLVEKAINERHSGLVTNGLDRIVAVHWLTDDKILFVESVTSGKTFFEELNEVRFSKVTALLAIVLLPKLPGGTISREMPAQDILNVTAVSFGIPIRCHPDEEYSFLYSGRWDGKTLGDIQVIGKDSGSLFTCGSFDPNSLTCELVWAFDIDRYKKAFIKPLLTQSKITLSDLMLVGRSLPIQFPEIVPSSEAIQFSMAITVLRVSLGDSWCNEHLPSNVENSPELKWLGTFSEQMKLYLLITSLGEMIFNLQDVPGFTARLKRFARVDLDSAVAEFEAARMLLASSIPLEFVNETQAKGLDYEARIILPDGDIACCEVKSKTDSTVMGKNTISNSLKDAANQLPKSEPGVIFLKIPEHWLSEPQKLKQASTP